MVVSEMMLIDIDDAIKYYCQIKYLIPCQILPSVQRPTTCLECYLSFTVQNALLSELKKRKEKRRDEQPRS